MSGTPLLMMTRICSGRDAIPPQIFEELAGIPGDGIGRLRVELTFSGLVSKDGLGLEPQLVIRPLDGELLRGKRRTLPTILSSPISDQLNPRGSDPLPD